MKRRRRSNEGIVKRGDEIKRSARQSPRTLRPTVAAADDEVFARGLNRDIIDAAPLERREGKVSPTRRRNKFDIFIWAPEHGERDKQASKQAGHPLTHPTSLAQPVCWSLPLSILGCAGGDGGMGVYK